MYTLIVVVLFVLSIYFGYRSHRWKKYSKKEKGEKDQIATLLENLNDGLIEYDGKMKVLRLNRNAEELLGVTAADVVGKTIKPETAEDKLLESFARVSFPAFGEKLKTQNKTDKPKKNKSTIVADVYDVLIKKPEEKKVRVFTAAKVNRKSNEPVGYIKVIRDITQEDLISHSKSDLVAVVAHQLRTPLSAVRWIFGSLLDEDYGKINEKQRELIDKGMDTNEELVKLVDDILDVSKIEEARFDYEYTKVDITSFIRDIVENLREKAASKNVNLLPDLPEEGLEASFDEERMNMVITNIIDNAINYSKDSGGSIGIEAKEDGDMVNIEIKDNGIGIPESAQRDLFTKFYRAINAKKMKPQGTGLGLFLAKTIVEGHGGTISFTSKEGVGTTFMLSIPKSPKKDAKTPVKSPSSKEKVSGL